MSEPLPDETFADPSVHEAYETCRRDEAQPDTGAQPSTIMLARLLGYLLLKPPNDAGGRWLAREINSAEGWGARVELAQAYLFNLICAFQRRANAFTRSDHPSRASFTNARAFLEHLITNAKDITQKAKYQALTRDNFRCVISQHASLDAMKLGLIKECTAPRYTELAHIIPASIACGLDGETEDALESFHVATFLTIAEHYGGIRTPRLASDFMEWVHRPENALTLGIDVHRSFDQLDLWLEPAEDFTASNTYRVCSSVPFGYGPDTIHFVNHDPIVDIPVPSSQYLAFHAACAQAVGKSGAGSYLTHLEHNLEFAPVLESDGSSANLLTLALSSLEVGVK